MPRPERPFRLFVIGAGFSVPAGLPLGDALLDSVVEAAKSLDGGLWYDNIMRQDIERFERYLKATGDDDRVTLEGLISFLDIEHHLRLSGSDTYTSSGNRTQMVIRNLLAWVLWRRMQDMTSTQWGLYRAFVRQLCPQDVIITFNYDLVLERAMRDEGVRFSLVPPWGPGWDNGAADDCVTLLKLHGSIDWFDSQPVRDGREDAERQTGLFQAIEHKVFGDRSQYYGKELTRNKRAASPLSKVYAIEDLDKYLAPPRNWVLEAPMVVSPSHHKIAYLPPLRDLWWGLGQSPGANFQMTIIGFSLPGHDAYLKQLVWHLVRSYHAFDFGPDSPKKDPLRLVDYRPNEDSIAEFRSAYSFVEWTKAETWFDGFNMECLPFVYGDWMVATE